MRERRHLSAGPTSLDRRRLVVTVAAIVASVLPSGLQAPSATAGVASVRRTDV
jgi:hypothetical protein